MGEVLSGAIDPSGKTVDEWTRDLTNDPTYANVASTDYTDSENEAIVDESASGDIEYYYNGIDYEEDIYLGYKFYETYWAEANETTKTSSGVTAPQPTIWNGSTNATATADAWYSYNVLYPFGYGLSYTEFSYDLEGVTVSGGADASLAGKSISENGVMTADNLSSSMTDGTASKAKISELEATVKVTNEGSRSGKETVQIYVEAPYDGKVEKPYYTLVGFAKTSELNPGQSETLEISFNVQDFASYDYSDANSDGHTGYELAAGDYKIHVMESSSHENIAAEESKKDAYESATFNLSAQANLDLDDFSENKIENLFSNGDEYDSMALAAEAQSMTQTLSRADFTGTMPEAPTASQTTLKDDTVANITKYDNVDADNWEDSASDPWYHKVADLEGWTQGTGATDGDGLYAITLYDMSGVPLDDELWVEFMNQLTWEEAVSLF